MTRQSPLPQSASVFLNHDILQSAFEELDDEEEHPERPKIAGEIHVLPKRIFRKYPSRESLARLNPFGAPPPSPDEFVLRLEMLDRISYDIDRLTPDQRNVVRMSLFERMSISEIAEAMGRENGAILSLRGRAFFNLRRLVRQKRFRR